MSSQIKITRAFKPEMQPLAAHDYRYAPPVQEVFPPSTKQKKRDQLSPFLLGVNGIFFSACLIMVFFAKTSGDKLEVTLIILTSILAAVLFIVSFVIGALNTLGKPEQEGNPSELQLRRDWNQRVWTFGLTLVGMVVLFFCMILLAFG